MATVLVLLTGCGDSSDSRQKNNITIEDTAIAAAESAALEALDIHLEARNNLDADLIASANNYPNLRLLPGFIQVFDDHESYSAKRARAYLKSKQIDPEVIAQVEAAILSTKTPQTPKDKISKILCDADLMNLTFDDYFEQIDLMRKEWEKVGKAKLNREEFYLSSLEFFQSHEYHSKYGKKVLQPKKAKTELKIRNKVFQEK